MAITRDDFGTTSGSRKTIKQTSPAAPKKPKDAQSFKTSSSVKNTPLVQRNTSYTTGPAANTYTPPGGGDWGGGDWGTGGGDMGGGLFGGMSRDAPSEEDYLAGDSGYQAQQSALLGALQRYLADADFQRNTYQTDYNRSLKDLGYDEGTKEWNWNDRLTASGRGYQNQLDDFGARGMLQSSGYADAYQELQRMLGQQYDSMSNARTTFNTDLDNQTANYKAENTANQQAARAEAIARRAAQYGL